MKELFSEYYQPDFNKLWEECVFVFDTNALLNLYRYSEKSKNNFYEILEKIKSRIWIPNQIAYEYQENRINLISNRESIHDTLKDAIDTHFKAIVQKIQEHKRDYPHETDNLNKIIQDSQGKILNEIEINKKEACSRKIKVSDCDEVRDKFTELFENKVGKPYLKAKLEMIFKEGEDRYKEKRPPGFKDIDKSANEKYGDLIIWFQIIDYALESKKSVIFITDDSKEDWWWIKDKKTVGPRPELIKEFKEKTDQIFYIYKPEKFMEYSKEYLGQEVSDEVINEVKKINEEMHLFLEQKYTYNSKNYNNNIEKFSHIIKRKIYNLNEPYQNKLDLIKQVNKVLRNVIDYILNNIDLDIEDIRFNEFQIFTIRSFESCIPCSLIEEWCLKNRPSYLSRQKGKAFMLRLKNKIINFLENKYIRDKIQLDFFEDEDLEENTIIDKSEEIRNFNEWLTT